MIFYLLYLSTATTLYTQADLSDILEKSRLNNTQRNITGFLLYHGGNILQILEGDEESVKNLYEKIKRDRRHHSAIKIISGTGEHRNFPDWSMGFKSVSAGEWEDLSGYLRLNPSAVLTHLKQSNNKIKSVVDSFMTVSFR